MNKLILTTSLLLVAVFTVAYLYFSNITATSLSNDRALSLIPHDAALIFQFKNDKSIYDIFSDYTVFDAIIGKQKQGELRALKTILQNSKPIFQSTLGQDIFISFHSMDDSVAFLWIMPLPQGIGDKDVIESLQENKDIQYKASKIGNESISEVYIKSLKRIFYLQVKQQVVSGSFSRKVMEESIDLKREKIDKKLIDQINKASNQNQNTPASVFVNFKNSIPFLSGFFQNKLPGSFSLLNKCHAIATLNMNFKSDALMFNGITDIDTSNQNYINLFLHQQAIKNTIKRVVPDNSANYIAYGMSDYLKFHKDLKRLLLLRKELDGLNTTLSQIKSESGIDPERDIEKYWADEFITFQLSTQEKYAVIQLNNGRQMQFFMEPLSTAYSQNIWHLNYPGLLYYYFGDPLKQFNKPFFTIVDNQMIISNSPESIQRYLDHYSRNLLYTNDKFMTFDQLVADRSNISIFVHVKNSNSNISSDLKPGYAKIFKSEEYGLKNFYGFSYQWTSVGDHFFTNFYAGFKQKQEPNQVTANIDSLN